MNDINSLRRLSKLIKRVLNEETAGLDLRAVKRDAKRIDSLFQRDTSHAHLEIDFHNIEVSKGAIEFQIILLDDEGMEPEEPELNTDFMHDYLNYPIFLLYSWDDNYRGVSVSMGVTGQDGRDHFYVEHRASDPSELLDTIGSRDVADFTKRLVREWGPFDFDE